MGETVTLVGGEVVVNVHYASQCDPDPCPIHRMTDHHMVTWPQHWRPGRGPFDYRTLMERTCIHGIGHPDPDDIRIRLGVDEGNHGCDSCCVK